MPWSTNTLRVLTISATIIVLSLSIIAELNVLRNFSHWFYLVAYLILASLTIVALCQGCADMRAVGPL
jgi:hypothetical protein